MRVQVAIIGGGPAGLLLGQLLHNAGIDAIVLERQTRDYVLGRIRAGVLERGTMDLLHRAGVGDRMMRDGFVHDGTVLAYGQDHFRLCFSDHIDQSVMVYGQTELTRDLYDARAACGAKTLFEVKDVTIHDAKNDAPYITLRHDDQNLRIDCDYIAGCDGFHGVSRTTIPSDIRNEYERVYPFGWLGVLSETPPVHDELIYGNSDRGFALCSMRNANLSRYYLQCALSDHVDNWSDQQFWDELRRRIPAQFAQTLITGASIEKSIAPLRSFICEPMQWGRLFLCGDAAHIVPPTGAKGLNSAAADVHYLSQALIQFYHDHDMQGINTYSETALARVWKTQRFSWSMTTLLHRFPDQSEFDIRMQRAQYDMLRHDRAAQASMAQNYVGPPYERG